jgi:hypothetical protein
MIFDMNDETIDACETCKEYKAIGTPKECKFLHTLYI